MGRWPVAGGLAVAAGRWLWPVAGKIHGWAGTAGDGGRNDPCVVSANPAVNAFALNSRVISHSLLPHGGWTRRWPPDSYPGPPAYLCSCMMIDCVMGSLVIEGGASNSGASRNQLYITRLARVCARGLRKPCTDKWSVDRPTGSLSQRPIFLFCSYNVSSQSSCTIGQSAAWKA